MDLPCQRPEGYNKRKFGDLSSDEVADIVFDVFTATTDLPRHNECFPYYKLPEARRLDTFFAKFLVNANETKAFLLDHQDKLDSILGKDGCIHVSQKSSIKPCPSLCNWIRSQRRSSTIHNEERMEILRDCRILPQKAKVFDKTFAQHNFKNFGEAFKSETGNDKRRKLKVSNVMKKFNKLADSLVTLCSGDSAEKKDTRTTKHLSLRARTKITEERLLEAFKDDLWAQGEAKRNYIPALFYEGRTVTKEAHKNWVIVDPKDLSELLEILVKSAEEGEEGVFLPSVFVGMAKDITTEQNQLIHDNVTQTIAATTVRQSDYREKDSQMGSAGSLFPTYEGYQWYRSTKEEGNHQREVSDLVEKIYRSIGLGHIVDSLCQHIHKSLLHKSWKKGKKRLPLSPFMVVTRNYYTENHTDVDNAYSVTLWTYKRGDEKGIENAYFLFPDFILDDGNGNKKALAIKLRHGTVIAWDARVHRHCTAKADYDRKIDNVINGTFSGVKKKHSNAVQIFRSQSI